MLGHRLNKFRVGRFFGQAKFFEFRFFSSNYIERAHTGFFDQRRQLFLRKRFDVVIDLFEINAVFTKQRRQIAAGRSGRFFVNCELLFHVSSYARPLVNSC